MKHGSLARSPSSICVGREAELARLRELVLSPPSVVLIEGEAGVGKTRVVRELLLHPDLVGKRAFVGHCLRMHEPFFLGPIIEALRNAPLGQYRDRLTPVAGVLSSLLPEAAPHLPPQPPQSGDPRLERHRIFRGLHELLDLLSPAVVVIEDVHWADVSTLEFVEHLLRLPVDELSVVLTYRREDVAAHSPLLGLASRLSSGVRPVSLHLAPFTSKEVKLLTEGFLGIERVSAEFAELLHERTAGIPFAVEEVLHLMQDRQEAIAVDGEAVRAHLAAFEVPSAVRGAVLERLAILPREARQVLDAAAVVGMPMSADLIAEVAETELGAACAAFEALLASYLLIEVSPCLFSLRHALAVQTVYDAIPIFQRRTLHERSAEALQAANRYPAALLAHHYREAGNVEQWGHFAELAGDAARQSADDRGAAHFYAQALGATTGSITAKVRISVKLGEAALFGDLPRLAAEPLRRLLDEEGDKLAPADRGEAEFSLARLLYHSGEAGRWYGLMCSAVSHLASRPDLAARAMVNLAVPRLMGGDLSENLDWLDRALHVASQQQDPVVTTRVLATRAAVLLSVGDGRGWAAIDDVPPRGSSVEQDLMIVRGYADAAQAALGLGHHERVSLLLDTADGILEDLHHDRWSLSLRVTRAGLDLACGRWNGLESRLRQLVEDSAVVPLLQTQSRLLLATLLLTQGGVEEAEPLFTAGMTESLDAKDPAAVIASATGLARLHMLARNPAAASEATTVGLDAVHWKQLWCATADLAPLIVEALVAGDRHDAASSFVSEMTEGVRPLDAPAAQAARLSCKAMIEEAEGRYLEAAELFRRASEAWAVLPRPLDAARAGASRGKALLSAGDAKGGAIMLEAFETLSTLSAQPDVARVRRALRAYGLTVPSRWRGGRTGYGDELSPREADVVRLAARGWTNQEIAERLFISRRTVEGHVQAALKKLGVASKRELQRGGPLA